MPQAIQSSGADRLHPVEPRHAPMFGFALLTMSCALASFALACATPFAAFAVIASATLSLRSALLVVAGAWLVNQTIGFSALHYPIDASTIAWGLTIGAATLAGTAASSMILRFTTSLPMPLALGLAFVAAYVTYEVALFAATPVLGGTGAFTLAIVTRIGLTNVAWLIGLVAACEIVRMIGTSRRGHVVS